MDARTDLVEYYRFLQVIKTAASLTVYCWSGSLTFATTVFELTVNVEILSLFYAFGYVR